MKICYYADGRYIHAERWMRYFAERGHEMHLISFTEITSERVEEYWRIGVKYHGATGGFHVKKFWRTLSDLRFLKSVLRREKIDVLHSHFLGSNAWYAALSGFHPHIITIMGGGDVNGRDWKPDSNLQSRVLTPYTLRNADYITSWSKLMAEVVEPYCPDVPIEVVHGGIELERFSPGPKPEYLLDRLNIPRAAKIVFSPRLMRPLSNIVEIGMAACLLNNRSDIHYLIAFPDVHVDQEYANMVKAAFAKSVNAGRVKFISEIPHNEMADYFRLADVTISIPDTDGTPMTVLESMACGTPTVIGNLPDYDPQYFENEKTTLTVDVKDPRAVADAILRLLSDSDLAARLAEEARRRVEATGSYEYQMSKMEEIYKAVVDR